MRGFMQLPFCQLILLRLFPVSLRSLMLLKNVTSWQVVGFLGTIFGCQIDCSLIDFEFVVFFKLINFFTSGYLHCRCLKILWMYPRMRRTSCICGIHLCESNGTFLTPRLQAISGEYAFENVCCSAWFELPIFMIGNIKWK